MFEPGFGLITLKMFETCMYIYAVKMIKICFKYAAKNIYIKNKCI